jgi:membrane fusion protein (multidrug efflux system)
MTIARSNWRWMLPAVLVALAGLGWFLFGEFKKSPPPTAPATQLPAVGVRPAVLKGVNQSFEFVGRIRAVEMVEIRARVEGFLEKVLFREGQDVKVGDLLYQIENAQFRAQVDQAKANLAVAEAVATNAKLEHGLNLELSKRQFSPQSLVDRNKAALDAANGRILQMQAALTQAEVNLDYTDIRSPIAGRIGRTAYTVGNLVNPASGVLAEIIREARRKEGGGMVKIDIRLRLSNGRDYPHPGVWNFTDPQVNQQTDTLIMRAIIPNPERILTDGQFVTAVIRERREAPRLVIPQAALQVDQSGYYALVVNEQHTVEQRRVQTGPNRGTDIVVTSGISEGDKVIVDGIQKARPGQVMQETVLPPAVGG